MTPQPVSLITSAAYVNAELSAEFGQLPPSFLPFGHKRLLAPQIASLQRPGRRLIVTLPQSFSPDEWDRAALEQEGVETLSIPDDLSLGESITHALTLADARGPVSILHGDTLFLDPLPEGEDEVAVATTSDAYLWGAVGTEGQGFVSRRPDVTAREQQVLAGWFSFSSAPALLRALTRARGRFLAALDLYAAERPLAFRQVSNWLDFGHLQTFYRARARASTARAFNSLAVGRHSVLKTGEKADKLAAEADWFDTIPPPLRQYTPAFLGREAGGYRIGYLFSPTLHELFVFGRLEAPAWRRVMEGCFDFLRAAEQLGREAAAREVPPDALDILALGKTEARLAQWARETGQDLDAEWTSAGRRLPSLRRIAAETARIAAATAPIPGVMHGDLCFPNTFFDFREQQIKVIDPRGSMQDGRHSVHGDLRYDLAKLNHSLEGYDLILAGRYRLEDTGGHDLTLHLSREGAAAFLPEVAAEFDLRGRRTSDAGTRALTVQLFLSMLPLHADRPDRQRAFLANALRLYAGMEASP
ncbi:capsular biosynthesis protein [Rhodovarius crocodyli]|uniref:Capsular biosynthesis protein n=1 Tax=Rhodovarius crocodyli TaxID=1979269 RepID=A0A437LYW3_9PROT|nr:capsular biosynthesis protein [Rhodovarius crocodyli]RVT90610.1 capsular biosynthesis protein [Rhodovarius crocodyli]